MWKMREVKSGNPSFVSSLLQRQRREDRSQQPMCWGAGKESEGKIGTNSKHSFSNKKKLSYLCSDENVVDGDMHQLHKVADEAHDGKADGGADHCSLVLCSGRRRTHTHNKKKSKKQKSSARTSEEIITNPWHQAWCTCSEGACCPCRTR